ncbi:MAG: DUF4476 domain-containing protein, partial [Ferruginibacter sp.]
GFPKSERAEQNLVCTIDQNDIGYTLKNFDASGWGLVNLQNSKIIMAADNAKLANVEVINKTDAFSNMLSNVVNDSTIRQAEAVKDEVKKAPETEIENTSSVNSKEKDSTVNQVMVIPQLSPAENDGAKGKTEMASDLSTALSNHRSIIKRTLFNKNVDGTEMIFIDQTNGQKDTVRVFIPVDKASISMAAESPKEVERVKEEVRPVTNKEEKSKDSRFLDVDISSPVPGKSTVENKTLEPGKSDTVRKADITPGTVTHKAQMINSDCKNFATEDDFLKLRKKMVTHNTDDDMITSAKKAFKSKCFTVEQVKNLSVLFLKDAGKYAFFDMAYPFVSDSQNFVTLQNQLSETYYINRFQVMIRH